MHLQCRTHAWRTNKTLLNRNSELTKFIFSFFDLHVLYFIPL